MGLVLLYFVVEIRTNNYGNKPFTPLIWSFVKNEVCFMKRHEKIQLNRHPLKIKQNDNQTYACKNVRAYLRIYNKLNFD